MKKSRYWCFAFTLFNTKIVNKSYKNKNNAVNKLVYKKSRTA